MDRINSVLGTCLGAAMLWAWIPLAIGNPASHDDRLPPAVHEVDLKFKPTTGVGKKTGLYCGNVNYGTRIYDEGMALVSEKLTRDGRLHGPQRQWYPDGQIRSLVNYDNGVLDGRAWAWDKAGKPLWGASMVRGSGILKTFYDDGTLQTEIPYRGGLKHGNERQWHKDGSLRLDMTYDAGHLAGSYRSYFPGGQLREEYFVQGKQRHGVCRVWDSAGRLVNIYGLTLEETPVDYPEREATPHYYVRGKRVTPAEYDRAAQSDEDLRRGRGEDLASGTIRPEMIPHESPD